MVANISSQLPDIPDQGTANAEFPGIRLPSIAATAARVPQTECTNCQKHTLGTHKTFNACKWINTTTSANWTRAMIVYGNNINEYWRRVQRIIQVMDRMGHGIDDGTLLGSVGLGNPSETYAYQVQSASGANVTLLYDTGNTDPRGVLLTSGSLLTLSTPSMMQHYRGYQIRGVTIAETLATGDTFTVVLDESASNITVKDPPSSGTAITATIRQYGTNWEQWVEPRDLKPFWARWVTKTVPRADWVTTGGTYTITLELTRQVKTPWGTRGTSDFRVYKNVTGQAQVKIWNQASTGFKIQHIGTDDYKCTVDFPTSLFGPTTESIEFNYWQEYSGASGVCVGHNRCGYARADYTDSIGEDDGIDDIKWYCQKGQLASGLANFRAQCYQPGNCNQFIDTNISQFMSPFALDLMNQLFLSVPWKIAQPEVLLDAVTTRVGVPSMSSLCGLDTALPGGYHPTVDLTQMTGAWAKFHPGSVHYKIRGFETLPYNSTGTLPDMGSTATWGDYGPAGGNYSKEAGLGGVALDMTNDPHYTQRSSAARMTPNFPPYVGPAGITAPFGHVQRCGHRQYKIYAPDIGVGTAQVTRDDCTFQRGFWTAGFTAQATVDGATIYYGVMKFTESARLYKDQLEVCGSSKSSGTAFSNDYSGGQLILDLKNKAVYSSSQTAPAEETETHWCQGGTNVADHPSIRVKNWDADANGYLGPRLELAHEGDCIIFPSAAGFHGPIADRRFWITKAQAYAGTAQTYIPLDSAYGGTSGAYYDAYVAIHGTFDAAPRAGSLPINHKAYAKKSDRLWIQDENDAIKNYRDAGGTINNYAIGIYNDGKAHYATAGKLPVISVTTYNAATADTVLTINTDYTYYGAEGQVWFKNRANVPTRACVEAHIYQADRSVQPLSAWINGVRAILENHLDEGGVNLTVVSVTDNSFVSLLYELESDVYATDTTVFDTVYIAGGGHANPNKLGCETNISTTPIILPSPGAETCILTHMSVEKAIWRIRELDMCPWSSSNVDSAKVLVTIGSLLQTVKATTCEWSDTSPYGVGEAGNNVTYGGGGDARDIESYTWVTGKNKFFHATSLWTESTAPLLTVGLCGIINSGSGPRAYPLMQLGTPKVVEQGVAVEIDCTEMVKVYLDNKHRFNYFMLLFVPGAGADMTLEQLGTDESLVAIRDATSDWSITYDNVSGTYYPIGSASFTYLTWDNVNFGVVNAFFSGITLDAKSRVNYMKIPNQEP